MLFFVCSEAVSSTGAMLEEESPKQISAIDREQGNWAWANLRILSFKIYPLHWEGWAF